MIEAGLLDKCMKLLTRQLEDAGLKVNSAALVVDSTIIEAAARPRNLITVSDKTPPTKTTSAGPGTTWTKKGKEFHYGYKEHATVDAESGFIESVKITIASKHNGVMLQEMLMGKLGVTETLADKAYASRKNRKYLKTRGIRGLILRKGYRNRPRRESDIRYYKNISRRPFTIEQQFGTKKRRFDFSRASYFTEIIVQAQSYLTAICCHLLKAVRMLAPPQYQRA